MIGGAREAAAAFLGRAVEREVEVALPGRLERRGDEIRDGAHNADGARWLVARLDRDDYTVVASILRDKDAAAMLSALATRGRRFVATQSSNDRALPADELARLAAAALPGGRDRAGSGRGARPRARAPARPRHRLAVPSRRFGEERGVI